MESALLTHGSARASDEPIGFSEAMSVAQFGTVLADASEALRADLYEKIDQVLAYSRRHYIDYQGKTHEREDLQGIVQATRTDPVTERAHLELLQCLFALRAGNLGLEQVQGPFGVSAVAELIQNRMDLFAHHRAPSAQPDRDRDLREGLIAKAYRLFRARGEIAKEYYRVSLIDGLAWYRTETLLPRAEVDALALPEWVFRTLMRYSDGPAEDLGSLVSAAVRRCIEQTGDSFALVGELMSAIANDPSIKVDTAVLTCPRGVGLDATDTISQKPSGTYFCCITRFRDGVETPEEEAAKACKSARAAIRGRMLQLKAKATRNCFHPGLLNGVDVEKAYDYMIYANEDAHYPGHKVARVYTGGRAPILIELPERGIKLPGGLCDLRCFRFRGDGEVQLFGIDEEQWLIRFAHVLKLVLEETYRLRALVNQAED